MIGYMASIRISGEDTRSAAPAFYIPNRLDARTLAAVVKSLGGRKRVCFLIEKSFLPESEMMKLINASPNAVLSFDFRSTNSRELRERLLSVLAQKLDILFVPGHPVQNIGTLSDMPMPFMMQLAALHISPVPIFVGTYCNGTLRTFTNKTRYDRAEIRFLPRLESGPRTGDRLLEAWMECDSELYSAQPILSRSVTRVVVENMRKNGNCNLTDGLDETTINYSKLLGVAMALARWLRDNVKEQRLGIILPPGKGGMIANLACMLAGIVPVNVNYTSSDSAFASIVRQSGIKHFITARTFMSKLPQFPWPSGESIIHLDKTLKAIGMAKIATWVAFAKLAPMPVVAATFGLDARKGDDEVALLFTSGSSGEPKGVPMTHRMILANCTQLLSKIDLTPGDNFLCSLPIFHSFGLTGGIFLPLVYGFGAVTYPSPLEHKKLNELVEKYKCTLMMTTPTFARGMLRRAHEHSYDSVKYFVVGAEKLQQSLKDEFMEKCGVWLLEGYGMTEAAPVCAANFNPRITRTEEQIWYVPGAKDNSVGSLVPGLAVRITDPDDDEKRLPLSERGMIWFKGANIFKGYIGRDDLNREVFRDGWFKSGDLGSVDLNGMLTLGGRRSRFSKIGGEMVPHEVVEEAIEAFVEKPEGFAGRAVAIAGVPDEKKGEAMVLLSAVHQTQLSQVLDGIREHLVAEGMPRLWCPREIIPVESIPTLPTGKMDLKGCQQLAYEALGIHA